MAIQVHGKGGARQFDPRYGVAVEEYGVLVVRENPTVEGELPRVIEIVAPHAWDRVVVLEEQVEEEELSK